jgi:iron complex transport system substrate-binding protein
MVASCFMVASCVSHDNSSTNSTVEYTDDYGTTVSVPVNPKRVVSLSPAATEIVFALGADGLLVGRTEFCVYPPEASRIENIGGISNLNIEKVLSCNPDLIISGSMVPQKVVKQFADMGVPLVCVIEKPNFDALYENISKIGYLIGAPHRADSLNAVLRDRMKNTLALNHSSTQAFTPSVYYVVGFGSGGNFTAGGNTFINDIIEMAGGRNIAADSEGWAYSLEALMQADPDFILIRAEDSARFCQTSPYNKLTAVRQGRTISLEDGILDLQVPRNLDVIQLLRDRFSQTNDK